MLVHKPKELSWEQAAGIPEVHHLPSEFLEHADCLASFLDLDNGYTSDVSSWRIRA